MAETAKRIQESDADQQKFPRRFSLWRALKKALYILLGAYIFIFSFNAGFHPNRVPELLKPAARVFVIPQSYPSFYNSFNARIQFMRSLNKEFPQGTPLSKVKSDLASMGFALSQYDAVFRADNFICAVTYRVIWKLDTAGKYIDKFGGGASMKCGIDL